MNISEIVDKVIEEITIVFPYITLSKEKIFEYLKIVDQKPIELLEIIKSKFGLDLNFINILHKIKSNPKNEENINDLKNLLSESLEKEPSFLNEIKDFLESYNTKTIQVVGINKNGIIINGGNNNHINLNNTSNEKKMEIMKKELLKKIEEIPIKNLEKAINKKGLNKVLEEFLSEIAIVLGITLSTNELQNISNEMCDYIDIPIDISELYDIYDY